MAALVPVRIATFSPMSHMETIALGMDFTPNLGGSGIASAMVTITLVSGIDPTPQGIAFGPPTVLAGVVSQTITGTRPGAVYQIRFVATLDSGAVLVERAYLPVLSES